MYCIYQYFYIYQVILQWWLHRLQHEKNSHLAIVASGARTYTVRFRQVIQATRRTTYNTYKRIVLNPTRTHYPGTDQTQNNYGRCPTCVHRIQHSYPAHRSITVGLQRSHAAFATSKYFALRSCISHEQYSIPIALIDAWLLSRCGRSRGKLVSKAVQLHSYRLM